MKQRLEIKNDEIMKEYDKEVSNKEIEDWLCISDYNININENNVKSWLYRISNKININKKIKRERVESFLSKKFREIEDKDESVLEVRMSSEMLKFLKRKYIVDPPFGIEDQLESGLVGWLWGAEVYIERDLNKIILISTNYKNETRRL